MTFPALFRFSLLLAASLTGPAAFAGTNPTAPARDYPVQPVPFTAVRIENSFWSPRFETNRNVTVWYDFKKCEETGRIDNFAKAGGLMTGEFKGIPFDDSDVYKVIEGAAYTLATHPDPKLDAYLDDLIKKIAAAQEPDGYLYTARRLFPADKMPRMSGKERWSNLGASHELYNVGHLYEAAVAHYLATGKRALLDVALKNADMLCQTFGPGKVQFPPGHEEIEMGLVKLYRATGEAKYLDLAKYYVAIRGRADTHPLYGPGAQDHLPVLEQAEAVGHAVRAGYFYSGVADVAALTGDQAYVEAIGRLWEDVVSKKLHLTGGIGAKRHGEAFGEAYELPNGSAYLETCAAIANALWNQRMFLLHGDSRYVDVLERILYNGFLSGVALTGDRFFYPNPLETNGVTKFNQGQNERAPWFGCSCCPVNVVRFIPSIAGYVYATRGDALYVNLFSGCSAKVSIAGQEIGIRQETRYPWNGAVKLGIDPAAPKEFELRVRIPGWARNQPVPSDLYRYADTVDAKPALAVNGQPTAIDLASGYAKIRRTWQKGDTVTLELPMPVRRVLSHEAVKENRGRYAVERGPLVYCAEGADNGGKVLDKVPGAAVKFTPQEQAGLLGGVTTIRLEPEAKGDPLTLIPYYAWANRGPNEMIVWMRTAPPPAPLQAASHTFDGDSLDACFDGIEPKSSGDQHIPRFTWWDHRGTTEWIERSFEQPCAVKQVAVYWFDDTGRGSCRVPASWRLLYREGAEWKPVAASGACGVAKDGFNTVTFPAVMTNGLRIEASLQPKFSGGILEWKME